VACSKLELLNMLIPGCRFGMIRRFDGLGASFWGASQLVAVRHEDAFERSGNSATFLRRFLYL